jgi:FKBP-type peptidyl-prolyl cis-trans isomerase
MKHTRWFRLSLGGMLILIALIALASFYYLSPDDGIIDLKVGTGPPVKRGDTISVHYIGTLSGGKVFDNSKTRGTPFDVTVGQGMVIQGWDIGLVGMKVGGIRRLNIPPELAYGARGVPPVIPPNASLHFDVELLAIK